MFYWVKILPYLLAIIGALGGGIKWLYGALREERDYYRKKFLENEDSLMEKEKLLAKMSATVQEQAETIKLLKMKVSDQKSGTFFDEKKRRKHHAKTKRKTD